MKKSTLFLLALLFMAASAVAQTARVQIIHNAPNPTVDVYVNGLLTLDNFAFRTATPYIDVPAGVPLDIAVAPENSTSAADAIANFPLTLANGVTYAVTASGIVGDPLTPFTLIADPGARETAVDPAKVELNVMHGAPDAPPVDVVVRTGGKIVSELAYGAFTPYLAVDPGVYYLDVKLANTEIIVGTYLADLTGLAGNAVRVLASGLVAGTPSFGLFAALTNGTVVELPAAAVARLQVIHNAPSPTVDVYANGGLLIDDFQYRTATPFDFVPAGVPINIGIALDNSTSVNDTLVNFTATLENGKTYIVTASGIVGDLATPFTLNINSNARETAAVPGNVDVAVLHGSTNAPNVDVDAVFVANNLIADLAYGEFTPYLELPAAKYDLAVRAAGDPNVVASFRADLSGLGGAAAYVFASGLLGDTPAFGLFAALPNGVVVELPLTPTAQVQVVHNSASPTVDVYAGSTLLLDNFAYRTATPFVTVPADIDIDLGVALESSTSAGDAIYNQTVNLEEGKAYTVFAEGLVGDPNTPFNLNAFEALTTGTGPTTVDISVHHGSTDAPNVDVSAVFENLTISNLGYGESTPYLALPATLYDFAIRAAGSPDVVAMYRADLSTLGGAAARVFASGTLAGTPAFGLFAVLPNGTVIELPATPTARVQVIHNSPEPVVDVYAGNDRLIDDFAFRTATPFVTLPADRDFTVGIAPADSDEPGDAIATFPFTLAEGENYLVTASGIVGDLTYPFTLLVNGNAREAGIDPNLVDVAVLHGSPGAPNVDVDALFLADNLIQDLAYSENTPYLGLEPGKYDLAVRAAGDPNIVAAYRADVSGLAGGAAYVFASGILGGSPGFGLFAALADGTVLELPATPTARVQVIHNSPEPTVDVYAGNSLLIDNFVFRSATPFIDVPSDRDITIGIALDNSTSVNDTLVGFPVNLATGDTYTVTATGLVGSTTTPFTLAIDGNARETAGAGFTALGAIQGAFGPGIFGIDVVERAEGVYFDNVDYGTYSGFIDVASNTKYLDVKLANLDDLIETYRIDLDTLDGQAVRLFTSGFLGTAPPLFGLFAALTDGTVIELPVARVARVQVVHNSPEPTVDVYANGGLFIDNFEFQTATPFVYVPAEVPINLGVALSNSTSVNDTLVNFTVVLENEKTYAVFASGIVGDPNTPFTLNVFDQARERNVDDSKIELAVHHGSPGAPPVDVQSYLAGGATIISDLTYGEFVDYLALDPDSYFLDIVANANPNTRVGIWGGDFNGLVGVNGIVYASGLLGGSPEFDLLLVLPTGDVVPLPSYALVQVIHNAPSPTVDVYFEDVQVLDNFAFRQATEFGLLPARFPFSLSVAPGNSTSVNDAIFSKDLELETGRTYIITAGGVVGTNFDLFLNENGREKAASGSGVDLTLFHGSPDAPGVDVKLNGSPLVIFDDVFFGEYSDYFSAPATQYIVDVTPANDNSTIVASYIADVTSLEGQAATVFASGFLNGTPGFEVWVALADGTTFPLPVYVSTNELDKKLSDLKLMPNPVVSDLNLQFELGENEALRYNVRDVTGRLMLEGDFGNVPSGVFQHKLNVGMLSPGMYQLEIVSDSGVKVAKFAVQR